MVNIKSLKESLNTYKNETNKKLKLKMIGYFEAFLIERKVISDWSSEQDIIRTKSKRCVEYQTLFQKLVNRHETSFKDENYEQIIIRLVNEEIDKIESELDKEALNNEKEILSINKDNMKYEITPEIKEKIYNHVYNALKYANVKISKLECESNETKIAINDFELYEYRTNFGIRYCYLTKGELRIRLTKNDFDTIYKKSLKIYNQRIIQRELKYIKI